MPNLAFTFSNGGQAGKKVIASRLVFGKGLTRESFATTRVSTMLSLQFVAKWKKPATSQLGHTVNSKAPSQTQVPEAAWQGGLTD
jgi:hypothetical protein